MSNLDPALSVLHRRLDALIDALASVPRLAPDAADLPPELIRAAIMAHATLDYSAVSTPQVSTVLPGTPAADALWATFSADIASISAQLLSSQWGALTKFSSPTVTLVTSPEFWADLPPAKRQPADVVAALAPLMPTLGLRLRHGSIRLNPPSTTYKSTQVQEIARWARVAMFDTVSRFASTKNLEEVPDGLESGFATLRTNVFRERELLAALMDWQRYGPKSLAQPPSPPDQAASLKGMLDKARSNKDDSGSLAAFQGFPVLGRRATMAKASRSWGAELEVTDAGHVYSLGADMKSPGQRLVAKSLDVPKGWAAVRDGSLRNMIGDGKWYDPWEFVSPIISTTFDPGLKQLCDQVDGTVKYQRAGVHIHVNATDRDGNRLTRQQIDRLLFLYNSVSPLFDPILMRRTREFCKPYDLDEWVEGWRRRSYPEKAARYLPGDPRHGIRGVGPGSEDVVENVAQRMRLYKTGHADRDNIHRYRDVNVESLAKHGTIEFRALGAVYNYEHIVKWAWMCREMVNYAASPRPLPFLTGVTTLDEFLYRLRSVAVESLSLSRSERAALAS